MLVKYTSQGDFGAVNLDHVAYAAYYPIKDCPESDRLNLIVIGGSQVSVYGEDAKRIWELIEKRES